jgi:molybdopterin biosynthesis enzyme
MIAHSPLTPLDQALAQMLDGVVPVRPMRVPVGVALGLVAAETINASGPVPAGAVALRDGIAVTSSELVGASAYSPALLMALPVTVRLGETLPASCDAVLPADAASTQGGFVEIGQAAYPGEGAALAGSDLGQGAEIVRAGGTVTAEVALALSAAGIAEIAVRRPVVRLPDGAPSPALGWLEAWLTRLSCQVVGAAQNETSLLLRNSSGSGLSNPSEMLDSTSRAQSDMSLLFHIPSGSTPLVEGLALKPGDSARTALSASKTPEIIMAERFDGIVAVAHALVLPLIARLTARRIHLLTRPLAAKVTSTIGVTDVALLRTGERGYEPLSVGRITLAALLAADAIALIPPDSEGAATGAPIDAIPLNHPLIAA